jgi:hypothetical protein
MKLGDVEGKHVVRVVRLEAVEGVLAAIRGKLRLVDLEVLKSDTVMPPGTRLTHIDRIEDRDGVSLQVFPLAVGEQYFAVVQYGSSFSPGGKPSRKIAFANIVQVPP